MTSQIRGPLNINNNIANFGVKKFMYGMFLFAQGKLSSTRKIITVIKKPIIDHATKISHSLIFIFPEKLKKRYYRKIFRIKTTVCRIVILA